MVVFNSGTEAIAHRGEHTLSICRINLQSCVIPLNNPQLYQLALLLLYILRTQVNTQLCLTRQAHDLSCHVSTSITDLT